MSNVAVIAEFHPYHNGHHYLFEEAMSLSHADHAIALMSGNFLQRGSIALWDKYTRAEMAVADGFDLCLELPFVYATGSAGDFADGAVAILKTFMRLTIWRLALKRLNRTYLNRWQSF